MQNDLVGFKLICSNKTNGRAAYEAGGSLKNWKKPISKHVIIYTRFKKNSGTSNWHPNFSSYFGSLKFVILPQHHV